MSSNSINSPSSDKEEGHHRKRRSSQPLAHPRANKFTRAISVSPRPSAVDASRRVSALYQDGGMLDSQTATQNWVPIQIARELDSKSQPEDRVGRSKEKDSEKRGDKAALRKVTEERAMGKEAAVHIGTARVDNDHKTPAHQQLIEDFNRLRSAFREGEEEREELSQTNLELKDQLRRTYTKLRRTRRYISLVGKQMVNQAECYGDNSDASFD